MRPWFFVMAGVLALFAPACGDSVTEHDVSGHISPFEYPTGPDRYEADNSAQAAEPIAVGVPQWRAVYPVGDEDWLTVELKAGVAYEFTASHLSINGDTWLYLYDTGGQTLLADNDDCVGYDSCFQYTPSSDGVYLLRVNAFDNRGLMSYRLEVHPFVDVDVDGWSTFHDCDDANAEIHPKMLDLAGDGIDQNCTGTDALVASVPDAFEDDDTAESATALVKPKGMQYEFIRRSEFFPEAMHTLHDEADEDWFAVEVPPHQMVSVKAENVQNWFFSDDSSGLAQLNAVVSELRVRLIGDDYLFIANDTETPKTAKVHVIVDGGIPPLSYLIYSTPQGFDRDGDGFGTMGMWSEHDCDDSDPAINDGATEIPGDGIDQDCNGSDTVDAGRIAVPLAEMPRKRGNRVR